MQGIHADIYNLRFIKPIDEEFFCELSKPYSFVVFVEEGIATGGVSQFLQLVLMHHNPEKKSAICAFSDAFFAQGKRNEILEEAGLSPTKIVTTVKGLLEQ